MASGIRISYRASIDPRLLSLKKVRDFVAVGKAYGLTVGVFDQTPDTEHEPMRPNGKLPPSPHDKAYWNIKGLENGHIKRDFIAKAVNDYGPDWVATLARHIRYGHWARHPERVAKGLTWLGDIVLMDVKAAVLRGDPSWANETRYARWKKVRRGGVDGFHGPLVRYGGLFDAIKVHLVKKGWSRS